MYLVVLKFINVSSEKKNTFQFWPSKIAFSGYEMSENTIFSNDSVNLESDERKCSFGHHAIVSCQRQGNA